MLISTITSNISFIQLTLMHRITEKICKERWQHWCTKISGVKVLPTLLISTIISNMSFIQLSLMLSGYPASSCLLFVKKPCILILDLFPAMHPYSKGKGGAKHRGGQNTRSNRCTLREAWASSGSSMEFADWVMSIQDQYDLIQDQQQNQPQNQQYYDATTGLTWVPTTMQAVYHAPANVATTPATVATPAGTTPTVYQPQPVLSTPPITNKSKATSSTRPNSNSTSNITSNSTKISKSAYTYTSTLCTWDSAMAQHWDSTDCSIEK